MRTMDKNKLQKAHDRVFGVFQEHVIKNRPRIGETFYTCTNTTKSIREDEWWRFIYVGTDKKVVKIKVLHDFFRDDKSKISHLDILELPLNDSKQAIFEPRLTLEIQKVFLITMLDEFGHIEIMENAKNLD